MTARPQRTREKGKNVSFRPEAEMFARGRAHVLHGVGPVDRWGIRKALCGITTSFYEPPPGPAYPRCTKCYGEITL